MSDRDPRPLVSARDVDRLPRGATLRVSPIAIVTPWARDRAAARGIRIETTGAGEGAGASTGTFAGTGAEPTAAPGTCGCAAPGSGSGSAPAPGSGSGSGSAHGSGSEHAPAPAPSASPAAWISPFSNRMLRGPDVSVLLGAQAASAPSGY